MQNAEYSQGIKLSNSAVKVLVSIAETGYTNEIGFASSEEAIKVLKAIEERQLLLSSGAVVNILEEVEYEVVPATLN